MKKVIELIMIAAVSFSLIACANKVGNETNVSDDDRVDYVEMETPRSPRTADDTSNVAVRYKDGTFNGSGDPHDKGNELATIIISNGRIVDVDFISVNSEGKTMGYNPVNDENTTYIDPNSNIMLDYLKGATIQLREAIINKQSYDVNIQTTNEAQAAIIENLKLAARRAIEKAQY